MALIPVKIPEGRQEVFTHRDDEGVFRHFPIEVMRSLAAQYGGRCDEILAIRADLAEKTVQHIMGNMGIEPERLERLCEPHIDQPAIAIFWEENAIQVIDGNHRYVKRWQNGLRWMNIFCFKRALWESMLVQVPDLPGGYLTGRSGVIEQERERGFDAAHAYFRGGI